MIGIQPLNEKSRSISVGELIGKKYITESVIAIGENISIFAAKRQNSSAQHLLALKFEKIENGRATLIREDIVIKTVKDTKHFAKIIDCGMHLSFNFMATELLGPSLYDLANRRPPCKLSLVTILKFAIQGFSAIQSIHQAGFTHCNIEAV
ncbi:MAG: hypothetical protein EZS28_016306 [Streblomastix strix]|uniref:Protein kinase domain-containing protein n=1 Tax=Streblomastix strix TaxID=222440 RepID=A0A5J4W012_9EUKA|nr:MAG: hypothetical protein EZS28_016306 [Streblomastix strix]